MMSFNVLNKKFLSTLCQLCIDIELFPDKSFDSLFDTRQSDLRYFLEWFVDNITEKNALTEAEVDMHYVMQKCGLCLSDEELNSALEKCTPTYDDLQSLNPNCIRTLTEELDELTAEFHQLQGIGVDLDIKYSEVKKKQNQLKEECNKYKKKLSHVKEELQNLNSNFGSIDKQINTFTLSNSSNDICLLNFENLVEEEHNIAHSFSLENCQTIGKSSLTIDSEELGQFSNLKIRLKESKYLSIISRGLLEELKFKSLKAEDFLSKLKDESDKLFTFDDVLNIWCDLSELNNCKNLNEEVDLLQLNNIAVNLEKECDLICHNFLSQCFSNKSSENEKKVAEYSKFINHLKFDVVNNLLLLQVLHISADIEQKCAHYINGLYSSLDESQSKLKNIIDTLSWKNQRVQEYHRHLNEKHALVQACNKITNNSGSEADLLRKNTLLSRHCNVLELIYGTPNFFSAPFISKMENDISASMSRIISGPTGQIQIAPVELQLNFDKCEELIAECSHSIQRLLTEYVNVKECTSSRDRRQLLLWIDFLMNPQVLSVGLEKLQEQSEKCISKYSSVKS